MLTPVREGEDDVDDIKDDLGEDDNDEVMMNCIMTRSILVKCSIDKSRNLPKSWLPRLPAPNSMWFLQTGGFHEKGSNKKVLN